MNTDEYEELIKDLVNQTGLDYDSLSDVVEYLQTLDLLDQAELYNRYVGDDND